MENDSRFDRSIRFFGIEGQKKIRKAHAVIVGAGGNGSHVIQQLALLGVGRITAIDDEDLSTSNKNRYIGALHSDPVPGTKKIDIARRLVCSIDPTIIFTGIHATLLSNDAFEAIKNGEHIFGCLDDDGPRFVLNDLTSAYGKPYIDLASDVAGYSFGGRVVVNWHGDGCLYCMSELDQAAVQDFLASEDDRKNRKAVYGIERLLLGEVGPSVVSVNGVVSSIAVTEYMAALTGLRAPKKFINYAGHLARVSQREQKLKNGCPYCGQWGMGERADVERYVRTLVNDLTHTIPHTSHLLPCADSL